jgi:KDO2-lipid IV(A) lauroyltransferase
MARLFLSFLQHLAADTASRVGGTLGVLAWRIGVRRRLVNNTLHRTLGLSGPSRARVSRRAYATMGANFIEIWTAGGVDGLERHAQAANPNWMRVVQARHPGLVIAAAHIGSWDGAVMAIRPHLTRLVVYAKAQHNPAMDELLNQRRAVAGTEILLTRQGDRTGAVTVLKILRDGGGAVGLLTDQRPRREEATPATFLGVAAWCHPGPAFFAQRARAWVVPAFALRVRAGETRAYMLRPFDVRGLAADAASQRIMDALSAVIAAFPGQYFWHHRRFGDAPAECPVADPQWRTGLTFFR